MSAPAIPLAEDTGAGAPLRRGLVLGTCTAVTFLYAMTVTIANVSLPQMQGRVLGDAGPDRLGGDREPRRDRGRDAAGGLAPLAVRAAEGVQRVRHRLRRRLPRVRVRRIARTARALPRAAGCARRAARAGVAGDRARHLPAPPARRGDRDLRHGLGARPDRGPGAGRLSQRGLRLALGVPHDHAVQRRSRCSAPGSSSTTASRRRGCGSTGWASCCSPRCSRPSS